MLLVESECCVSTEDLETVQAQFQLGKSAFERGLYRNSVEYLEAAASLVDLTSHLGGEVQIWLVTAYEAFGKTPEAIALCEHLTRHPDYKIRKQGRRLLVILNAPRLRSRPEWVTQIPDLTGIATADDDSSKPYAPPSRPRAQPKPAPKAEPEPIDLSQVNTRDNQFVLITLGAIALMVAGLIWFGR